MMRDIADPLLGSVLLGGVFEVLRPKVLHVDRRRNIPGKEGTDALRGRSLDKRVTRVEVPVRTDNSISAAGKQVQSRSVER
jgi:hypothetical protein